MIELQSKNIFVQTFYNFIIHICIKFYLYGYFKCFLFLLDDKEKISKVCDYKHFDETLLLQSTIVKDLQDKRGIYAYQATAYKEYVKQLSVKDPCCPLCHRNFEEQAKVADLIKEIESDIIRNQPDRLKLCEQELKLEQEKYDNMLQLKSIVEKVIKCEENDLKALQ